MINNNDKKNSGFSFKKFKKKLLIFVFLQFLIGNVVSWFFGAWPINFPRSTQESISEQEVFFESLLEKDRSDFDAAMRLGMVYFNANWTDSATTYLERAFLIDNNHAELNVYIASNNMKKAGAMFDPLWGVYKLYLTNKSVEDLAAAINSDTENVQARVARFATLSRLGDVGDAYKYLIEDAEWLSRVLDVQGMDNRLLSVYGQSVCAANDSFGGMFDYDLYLIKSAVGDESLSYCKLED